MKRIKFKTPIDKINYEFYNTFKWFMDLVEWGYGDTYLFIGSDVVKLVEIKFKEDVNPEKSLKNSLKFLMSRMPS